MNSRLSIQPLTRPIEATVTAPGSKSYTIRALLLAALTPQPVRILNPLFSDDTQAMMACLNALGVRVTQGDDWMDVQGWVGDVSNSASTLNADLSAASIRFLLALCCIVPGIQVLHGQEGLNKRPVRDLVDSLRQMGAQIEYLEREGYPPVKVTSSVLNPGPVSVDGRTSSQYVSALLMIAPLVGETTIEISGELISRPYLEMTASIMQAFGVTVQSDAENRFIVPAGQAYQIETYTVEADASSAAYFLALAALTKSRIMLDNINRDSAQADMRFIQILADMGNRIIWGERGVTIEGQGVRPVDVDMRDCPDQAQTLAVLAAFANGVTRITGLQSLRVKETDRIAAVQQELAKMGIQTESKQDELIIYGGNPQPASIATYGDHRMAMSFAVAGAALAGMEILDPKVVGKTFPTFWNELEKLGIEVLNNQPVKRPCKIVLIGFMGAGKTLLAPKLAEQLGMAYVETDQLIVERSGRQSINEIFELDGESRFRELEMEVACALCDCKQTIISTGGGMVMNNVAMEALREQGATVLLETALETIMARLASDQTRPLLQNNSPAALYEMRAPLYAKYADLRVQTDEKSPTQILTEVLNALQARFELKTVDLRK